MLSPSAGVVPGQQPTAAAGPRGGCRLRPILPLPQLLLMHHDSNEQSSGFVEVKPKLGKPVRSDVLLIGKGVIEFLTRVRSDMVILVCY